MSSAGARTRARLQSFWLSRIISLTYISFSPPGMIQNDRVVIQGRRRLRIRTGDQPLNRARRQAVVEVGADRHEHGVRSGVDRAAMLQCDNLRPRRDHRSIVGSRVCAAGPNSDTSILSRDQPGRFATLPTRIGSNGIIAISSTWIS